jgi:hypothetical protein
MQKPVTLRFVEFVGLPGAGKSTIATLLAERLKKAGWDVRSRGEILGDRLGFLRRQWMRFRIVVKWMVTDGRFSGHIVRYVRAAGQITTIDAIKVIWNFWVVLALMADHRQTSNNLMIVDQGLLQAVWSILLTTRNPNHGQEWLRLLDEIGLHDAILIYTSVSSHEARQRLRARKRPLTRMAMGWAQDVAIWERAENISHDLVQGAADWRRFHKRGYSAITTVDTSTQTPVEEAVSKVQSFVFTNVNYVQG